jgi:lysine 6-dehydrogenase
MTSTRKILLLGCGLVGSEVAKDIRKTGDFSRLLVTDINPERAAKVSLELSDERISGKFVDVFDKNRLVSLMDEYDVIADCTDIRDSMVALEAAIEAQKNYVNLTGALDIEKIELDGEAIKAEISAILSLGCTPGITNILAKHGANHLDEVEKIQVSWEVSGPMVLSPGLLESCLHQFDMEQPERSFYENGEYTKVPPFYGEKIIKFAEPIGERKTYIMAHGETRTIPKYIKGVKIVETRGFWEPETMDAMRAFYDHGLFSKKPVKIGDASIMPRNFLKQHILNWNQKYIDRWDWSCFLNVEVIGKKDNKELRYLYDATHPLEWGKKAGAIMTAMPMSIGIQMLAKNMVKTKGVFTPEGSDINPKVFFNELSKRGIKILERKE